jgi:hypothetical protein
MQKLVGLRQAFAAFILVVLSCFVPEDQIV